VAGRIVGLPRNAERPYAFPALLRTEPSDEPAGGGVVVEIYRLADPSALARLDVLEAYDPADEAGSEYLRRRLRVHDGPVGSAWTWVFAGAPPPAGEPIPDGDWRSWAPGRPARH